MYIKTSGNLMNKIKYKDFKNKIQNLPNIEYFFIFKNNEKINGWIKEITKNGMVKIKFLDRENFIFEEKNFYISKIRKIYKADVFRFSGNEIGYYIDDD